MVTDLIASIDWIWLYLVPFMGIITVIVFAHEMGHYLAAKFNGVKVEVFSVGFGPEIFGFNDKSGTRWKFSWIPMGGYVRMFSDADASSKPDQELIAQMSEEEKQQSHFHKTVWQRTQISAAGPLANFIFSIVLFTFLYSTTGQKFPGMEIDDFTPNSPAQAAGMQKGDKILAIDGVLMKDFVGVVEYINNKPGKPIVFELQTSGGKKRKISVTPEVSKGNIGVIGIKPKPYFVVHALPFAFLEATKDSYKFCAETLKGVGRMITGKASADGLSGPIGIAKIAGNVANTDFYTVLFFMAVLSLSLGLINLFPIPMLDGGHLLFYAFEAIIGRPLSERAQEIGFTIGLGIVGSLMLFSTWNDLSRLQWVQKIMQYFNF